MAKTCQVKRDQNNEITTVLDRASNESKLYNQIVTHPLVNDKEAALSMYKNLFTGDFNTDESATNFSHRLPDGSYTNSYREALEKAPEGKEIEIGIRQGNKFESLLSVSKTTNKNTEEGFINSAILDGFLSDVRVRFGNNYYIEGAGRNIDSKIASVEILAPEAYAYLGVAGVSKAGQFFTELRKTKGKTVVALKEGGTEEIDVNTIDGKTYEELNEAYENATEMIAELEYRKAVKPYRDAGIQIQEALTPSEQTLQVRLLRLLNNMGVDVVSITNYTTNYKIRNGVNPSAKALADIANKVIAVQQGVVNTQDLTEEVAHFINEAIPQERVENILRNIHRSEEWKEYYQVYDAIYSEEYTDPQERDQAVRREVLGKIVANTLQNKEATTETQQNFFEQAASMVREFFQRISNYFKPEFRTQLDEYLNDVENLLYSEDVSSQINTENFKNNKYRFYSVEKPSPLYKKLNRLNKLMQTQVKTLLRSGNASRTSLKKLEAVEKELNVGLEKQGIVGMLDIINHNLNKLNASLNEAKKSKSTFFMSAEENIVIDTVYNKYRPILEEVRGGLVGAKYETEEWNQIRTKIDNTLTAATTANSNIKDFNQPQKLVDSIMEKYNFPPSHREAIEQWVEVAQSDTAWFHSTFGQLIHARDGMLNVVGILLKNMSTEGSTRWVNSMKVFQQVMRDNNMTAQQLSEFVADSGQYYLAPQNWGEVQRLREDIAVDAYIEVEKPELSREEVVKLYRDKNLDFSEGNRDEYNRLITKKEAEYSEKRHNPEYYEEYEEKLKDKSLETRVFLKTLYADIAQLRSRATRVIETKDDSGNIVSKEVFDFSSLSPQDVIEWMDLNRKRKDAKSYTDVATGELKRGISYITDSAGNIITDERGNPQVTLSPNASVQARMAYEINQMDEEYAANIKEEKSNKTDVPQVFLDELKAIETVSREEALRFVELNTHIGFSQKFWDSFGGGETLASRLLEQVSDSDKPEVIIALRNDIIKANRQLKDIIRSIQNKNRPAEIDEKGITADTKETILALQEKLSNYYKEARTHLPKTEANTANQPFTTSTTGNEAYLGALRERDVLAEDSDPIEMQLRKLEGEIEFAKANMTSSNRDNITIDAALLIRFRRGEEVSLNRRLRNTVEDTEIEVEDLKDDSIYVKFMQAHVRKNLAAYYTRFSTLSYESFMEVLYNSDVPPSRVLEIGQQEEDLNIQPNYSFFDSTVDKKLNPKYEEGFIGGGFQPQLREVKYNKKRYNLRDERFFNTFGNITTNVNGEKVAAKNKEKFAVYQALMNYKVEMDRLNGLAPYHNSYTLPQIRKQFLQRFTSFLKNPSVDAIKNAFRVAVRFTEEDQVKGDETYGSDIKVVPTRYVNTLENPEDISTEAFFSTMLYGKEAYMKDSRNKYYADVMALYNQILNRTYNGVDSKASNTKKMLDSAVDNAMFGIREEKTLPINTPFGKVDVARIARLLLDGIKFRNLGLNIIIPLTSWATAKISQKIETITEEHISRRSYKMGRGVYMKKAGEAFSEFGKIDTTAEINVLGQYFGAFDLEDSIQNSDYGFLARILPRTTMGLHAMSNYPIYAKNMYAVLHDFRIVGDRLVNFSSFRNDGLKAGKAIKDIKNEWQQNEDQAIYKYINIEDDGSVRWDEAGLSQQLNIAPENLQQELNNITFQVKNYITQMNEYTDLQLSEDDRLLAQRHYLLSYLMTHRGWLSIASARRFKRRNFNFALGREEEGIYNTAFNFIGDFVKEWREGNFKNVVGAFQTEWNKVKADPVKSQNLKRIGIELAMLNSVALLSLLLRSSADDEDNKDLFALQLTNLVAYRTLNETVSAQYGVPGGFWEVIKQPFVGMNTVKDIGQMYQLFNGDEVERGIYKGYTQRERWLLRMVPGAAQANQLSNLQQTYQTYKFFNSNMADASLTSLAAGLIEE